MNMPDDDELRAAEALILENVALGFMEIVGVFPDGQIAYQLTPAGKRRVEELLQEEDEPPLDQEAPR